MSDKSDENPDLKFIDAAAISFVAAEWGNWRGANHKASRSELLRDAYLTAIDLWVERERAHKLLWRARNQMNVDAVHAMQEAGMLPK